MILIVAAMEEELQTAMRCCRDVERVAELDLPVWHAKTSSGIPLTFLRAGIGPKKSARRLAETLDRIIPELVLVAGYAGALDPSLHVGDLVAVTRATPFRLNEEFKDWDHVETDTTFDLTAIDLLTTTAAAAGLSITAGSILSSKYILGNPEHKNLLFRRFQASVVDMETAFLAREAAFRGFPTGALRVISDTAQDSFLAAFERDPDVKLTDRARKLLHVGSIQSVREWKSNAATARNVLQRFWKTYLK